MFEAMDAELKGLLDHQIAALDAQIKQTIASDEELAATADILRSVPGIGPVASTMLIAEMPELGQISGNRPQHSLASRPSHRTVALCAASAPLQVDGACCGM
ncbi:hypothetical protein [Roseinatronobacter alkalisoli]|uniref:IS110 family transposase n=1 Tax=Roseinatronobacter alkalisoli TaxID=3028235 RepID=A0ABT5TD67_9RHOB|nr:hypothetical protein [Roseinatronobacter sp. HJB301]MDD7972951.1 hypothetical protein [Roseinatronobacter sp. HJB301]